MSGILIVTEDRELVKVIQNCLRGTKVRVAAVCATSRSALDSYKQAPPDMVILETFLPDSSGLEMLVAMKRINDNCIFMMLSRLRTRTAIERAFRLGAHDVMQFPLDPAVLCLTIQRRLESQVTQRKIDEK